MAASITQSGAEKGESWCLGRFAWDAALKTTRDKPRPVMVQNGMPYLILKYRTIPYFKGRVSTLLAPLESMEAGFPHVDLKYFEEAIVFMCFSWY